MNKSNATIHGKHSERAAIKAYYVTLGILVKIIAQDQMVYFV